MLCGVFFKSNYDPANLRPGNYPTLKNCASTESGWKRRSVRNFVLFLELIYYCVEKIAVGERFLHQLNSRILFLKGKRRNHLHKDCVIRKGCKVFTADRQRARNNNNRHTKQCRVKPPQSLFMSRWMFFHRILTDGKVKRSDRGGDAHRLKLQWINKSIRPI